MTEVPTQGTDSQPTPVPPGGTVKVVGGTMHAPVKPPRPPWYRRVPSVKRLIVFSLFVFALAAAGLVGGVLYIEQIAQPAIAAGATHTGVTTVFQPEEAKKRVFQGRDRINILVLGIDYNYTNQGILYTKGARSDTILVVSLSREAEFLNVVSIPRDCSVLISEDYGHDKINGAFAVGGVEQSIETISEFLGVPIHHHVVVKVKGAREIIDALGGLALDVEKDMDWDDNWGKLHIHLKKGPQLLNGEQAVGYARFRMDEEGDRGRIRRQQQVIKALGSKLKDPSTLPRLKDLAKVVKQNVETDLNMLTMTDIATLYSKFDFGKMQGGAIVGDDAVDPNGISYIVPYAPENDKTVRRLLKDARWMVRADYRLRVLNSSDTPGSGSVLAAKLEEEGFRVARVANSEGPSQTNTRVILHRDLPRIRGVLQSALGRVDFEERYTESQEFDATIMVGNDRKSDEQLSLPPRPYPTTGTRTHSPPSYPRARRGPREVPIDSGPDPAPPPQHEEYSDGSSPEVIPEDPVPADSTDFGVPEPAPLPEPVEIPMEDPAPAATPWEPAPIPTPSQET